MKHQTPVIIITCLLKLLLFDAHIVAQSKALPQPKYFDRPIDNSTGFGLQIAKERIKAPWIVICDRNNAQTYKDNKGKPTAMEHKTLKFKDWFYVSDETDQWVRIFKGRVSHSDLKVEGNAEDYGWIEKSKILQWKTGLIDSKTRINLKCFLLNKATDIQNVLDLEKKEIVPIFKGPNSNETIGDKTIYEFYFVYKKENDKYLISKNVNINPVLDVEDLVGWVRKDRLEEWNTRICLEPNFREEAYEERKNNRQFHFLAYGAETSARTHATQGKIESENIFWENDPVALDKSQLATDGRRFKGAVVRFPMLSSHRVTSNFYRSGIIGDISVKMLGSALDSINEINYSGILKSINNQENSRNNYNVLFVIEGSQGLSNYKEALIRSLKKIQPELSSISSVRYGAAIYRDSPEKEHDKLFEIQPLTENLGVVTNFIEQSEFRRWSDNDDYTAMRFGINQSLIEAGFNNSHTNILVLIGNDADFYANKLRRFTAKEENDPTYYETGQVADQLANFNIHYIAVQCRHAPDRESVFFVKQVRDLMTEAAKQQYDLYKGVTDYVKNITLINPRMPEDEGLSVQKLVGGPTIGILKRPSGNGNLTEEELSDFLSSSVISVYSFVDEFWRKISKIANDGSPIDDVSAGEFAPAAAKILKGLFDENDKKAYTREDIIKLTGNKYKLYTQVYIPKHIKDATYPTSSQVLFMPISDLESYTRTLDRLIYRLSGPPDELRKELYNSLRDLIKHYTGSDFIKNVSTEDLQAYMQGITKEGLNHQGSRDEFLIEDVKSPKKVSDERVRSFSERMAKKNSQLKRILRKGRKYEFSYTSKDNLYFWVPIEMTF